MLKDHVQVWNALRKQDPGYIPNLRAMDLDGRDLSGANLSEADLRGAYLIGTKLMRANLRGADLRRAHLRDGNLCGADLTEADLSGAELPGAQLRGGHPRRRGGYGDSFGQAALSISRVLAAKPPRGATKTAHKPASIPQPSAAPPLLRTSGINEGSSETLQAHVIHPGRIVGMSERWAVRVAPR